MKIVIRLICSFLMCLWIVGCTQTPKPVAYKYSTQPKMQAAYHWNVLANDVAKQIKMALIASNATSRPVYVEPGCGAPHGPCQPHEESPFEEGFRDLLMSQLVVNGIRTLAEIEEGALIVNTKSQVVYHREHRLTRTSFPGLMTAAATVLSGAVMVIRDAYDYGTSNEITAAWAGTGLFLVGAYDALSGSYNSLPHSEVIITTSIKDYNSFLLRKSDIYYINDLDYWHYKKPEPQTVIQITGS